jgi:S1-C subfamily serine protease
MGDRHYCSKPTRAMIRRPMLFLLLLSSACVSPSTLLVNRDGRVIRCATTGYGYGVAGAIAIGAAQSAHNACVRDAQRLGFVKLPEAFAGINFDPKARPLKITNVTSPAQEAGIRKDDVLLELDETKVEDAFGVLQQMSKKQVGEALTVKIERNGKTIEFVYNAGQRP